MIKKHGIWGSKRLGTGRWHVMVSMSRMNAAGTSLAWATKMQSGHQCMQKTPGRQGGWWGPIDTGTSYGPSCCGHLPWSTNQHCPRLIVEDLSVLAQCGAQNKILVLAYWISNTHKYKYVICKYM